MATNTTAPCGPAGQADTPTVLDPFLTVEEAGATVRKSGRWVERHLHEHRNAGAPRLIVLPSSGASGRAAAKLVDRDAWLAWVRSWGAGPSSATGTAAAVANGRAARPVVVPVGLQSSTQRRRAARGF